MPILNNKTPFAANYVVLPNTQGIDTLYVNVKGSLNLSKNWTLCDAQPEPLYEDVYWGETGKSSLKYPTSTHIGKPSTDIIILGHAWAPNRHPVKQLDVSATVGANQKVLRVFGDRFWLDGKISHPHEFTHIPIRYENAYGGQHWLNDQLISLEPRNPVGKGYCGKRKHQEMNGQPLPNIENPHCLITTLDDTPEPAGFGAIAANWHPRATFAGTYDEQWQKSRAPYLPNDYQPQFQNSAHPDLISQQYLTGGEQVTITNMHPDGTINFCLPHITLVGKAVFHATPALPLYFTIETLIIDIDTQQLTIDWKASCLCNNAFPLLNSINIHLSR